MGVLHRCYMCGKSQKTYWPCDCPTKLVNKCLFFRNRATIVKAAVIREEGEACLYEHLLKDGMTIYMLTRLSSESFWPMIIIGRDSFIEALQLADDYNLDNESDEWFLVHQNDELKQFRVELSEIEEDASIDRTDMIWLKHQLTEQGLVEIK